MLEDHLGSDRLITDPELMLPYGKDESSDGPFPPDLVVRPESPDEARVALRLAREHRVPITPRGAGTGKSGGALPVRGGVVLSFERMNRILDIEPSDLVALVEPGVITGQLHEAVEAQGLFYPPDPASLDSCTLGGNVAENAGGPRAMLYGVTNHYTLGLEVALMDGTKLELGGRTLKNVAGYDLTSLVVGSEGTLAVMTRLNLRLVASPLAVAAAWAVFPDTKMVGRAVSSILLSGLGPRCLELMDQTALDHGILEQSGLPAPLGAPGSSAPGSPAPGSPAPGSPPPGSLAPGSPTPGSLAPGSLTGPTHSTSQRYGALLIELDGHPDSLESRLIRCSECCEAAGAVDIRLALDEASRRRLWKGRRQVATALKEAHPYKVSEDIAVPLGRIPDCLEAIQRIGATYRIETAVFGHAGDGNLHVNLLADDPQTRALRVKPAVTELMVRVMDLGGTITAEHGVGTCKRTFMPMVFPPQELDLMRRLKAAWDPMGLLNPDKVIP